MHPHIYIIIPYIFFVRFGFGLKWLCIVKVLLSLLFWFPIVGVLCVIYGVGYFFGGVSVAKAFQGLGRMSGTNAERLAHTGLGSDQAGAEWFETDTSYVFIWSGSAWFQSVYSGLTAAGGVLTGTYPNPSLATNAVGTTNIVANAVTNAKLATNEAWRVVGASGQPAFENSWTNYDITWASARFKKDITNTVFIEGLVRSGTAATIFTLPAGYRPTNAANNMFTGLTNPNVVLRFNITSAGAIVLDAGYSNTWASITCSFKAE